MYRVLMLMLFTISLELATCSISGLTYRDDLSLAASRFPLPGQDPCKPLYWYPRQIPEYCYRPQPLPPVLPPPPPPSPPPPPPLPLPPPLPMPIPLPMPANPLVLYSSAYQAPMLPPPAYPYPPARLIQAGMVPGISGLVSPDGGINVLPFSDAYSDFLEKHKQKVTRIRLQKILDEYERYPRSFRRRKYRRRRLNYSTGK